MISYTYDKLVKSSRWCNSGLDNGLNFLMPGNGTRRRSVSAGDDLELSSDRKKSSVLSWPSRESDRGLIRVDVLVVRTVNFCDASEVEYLEVPIQ